MNTHPEFKRSLKLIISLLNDPVVEETLRTRFSKINPQVWSISSLKKKKKKSYGPHWDGWQYQLLTLKNLSELAQVSLTVPWCRLYYPPSDKEMKTEMEQLAQGPKVCKGQSHALDSAKDAVNTVHLCLRTSWREDEPACMSCLCSLLSSLLISLLAFWPLIIS